MYYKNTFLTNIVKVDICIYFYQILLRGQVKYKHIFFKAFCLQVVVRSQK